MELSLEAIYKDGVFTPNQPLDLANNQRVRLIVQVLSDAEAEQTLAEWQAVYQDLAPTDLDEIEAIALDRTQFMSQS